MCPSPPDGRSVAMPVTTREQAAQQCMTDENMVSLENPPRTDVEEDEAREESQNLDRDKTYHPLFYISDDIPVEVVLSSQL